MRPATPKLVNSFDIERRAKAVVVEPKMQRAMGPVADWNLGL